LATTAHERGRVDFIQALRGVAALAVVGFHARGALDPIHGLGDRLFAMGFAGVDLFFVISGFIMVEATATRRPDGAAFLIKRLARVWPVYVIATIVHVAVRFGLVTYLARPANLRALGKAFVFYPQAPHGAPFLGFAPDDVGWTLNYEFAFYVIFAISLAFNRARYLVLSGLFVILLIIVPLVLGHGALRLDPYGDYHLRPAELELTASPMMWEFLAGVGVALIYRSRFRIASRALRRAFVGVAVIATIAQYLTHFRCGYGITYMGATLVVLVLALALAHKEEPLRVPRWLLWLGNISFSLYLFHRVAQHLIFRLCWGTRLQPQLDRPSYFIVSTALALGFAQLSYVVLERGLSERVRAAALRLCGR